MILNILRRSADDPDADIRAQVIFIRDRSHSFWCQVKAAVKLPENIQREFSPIAVKLQVQVPGLSPALLRVEKSKTIGEVQGRPFIRGADTHIERCIGTIPQHVIIVPVVKYHRRKFSGKIESSCDLALIRLIVSSIGGSLLRRDQFAACNHQKNEHARTTGTG